MIQTCFSASEGLMRDRHRRLVPRRQFFHRRFTDVDDAQLVLIQLGEVEL